MIRRGIFILAVVLFASMLVFLPVLDAEASDSTYFTYDYYDGSVSRTSAVSYADCRTGDGDTVDYGGTGWYVGQDLSGSDYTIWRGCLYFDTTTLSERANISSAVVKLYGKTDNDAGNACDLTLYRGSELDTPPSIDDYAELLNETSARSNTLAAADFDDAGWNTFTLNADGIGDLVSGGVTKFCIRASDDVGDSAPAGAEYVEFWSSAATGSKRPRLEITYTLDSLGTPDEYEISDCDVFTRYLEEDDDDFLFVFRYKVVYSEEPAEDPGDLFTVTLYDSSNDIVGIVPLAAFGYKPGSIYLSSAASITWEGTYTLKIEPRDDYDWDETPGDATYSLDSDDWRGSDLTRLDSWVRTSGTLMQNYYDETWLDDYSGDRKLNETGGTVFKTGIPYLDSVRPELFAYAEEYFDWDDPGYSGAEEGIDEDVGNYDRFGTTLTTAFDNMGTALDIEGEYVAAIIFLLLIVGVIALVYWKTGNAVAGICCAIPFLFMAGWLGAVPMAAIAVIGVIALGLLARELWLRGI